MPLSDVAVDVEAVGLHPGLYSEKRKGVMGRGRSTITEPASRLPAATGRRE